MTSQIPLSILPLPLLGKVANLVELPGRFWVHVHDPVFNHSATGIVQAPPNGRKIHANDLLDSIGDIAYWTPAAEPPKNFVKLTLLEKGAAQPSIRLSPAPQPPLKPAMLHSKSELNAPYCNHCYSIDHFSKDCPCFTSSA